MSNIAEIISDEMISHFGPGRITAGNNSDNVAGVQLSTSLGNKHVQARIATPLAYPLSVGDEVLVAGDDIHNMYVIGVLFQGKKDEASAQRLDIGGDAYITLDRSAGAPVLQVFSKHQELLLEYEPESERTHIHIAKGNLEFSAQNGDIVFNSRQAVRVNGEVIDLAGCSSVQLSVKDMVGQLISSLSLRHNQMQLNSARLGIAAHKADMWVKDGRYTGNRFAAKLAESRLIVGKLTTIAKSVSEKAVNVYRTVEELVQERAGRMRIMVGSTYHIKAENAYMKSQKDFKVNADKIHLG